MSRSDNGKKEEENSVLDKEQKQDERIEKVGQVTLDENEANNKIHLIIFIKNIIIVILEMFSIPLLTLYIVVIIRSKATMEIGVLYKYWEDMKLLMSYRSTILTTMKIIIINIFINVPRYFPYNFSILLLIFKSFS